MKTFEMVEKGENTAHLLEGINSDLDDYDELMKIVSDPNVKFSGGENSLIANYLYSLGDNVFENSITIESKTEFDDNDDPLKTKLNISTVLDPEDNRFKMLNTDGTGYITVSEVLAMAKNAIRTTDGDATDRVLMDFVGKSPGKDEGVWKTGSEVALKETKKLFRVGVLDKNDKVVISPHKVKTSAMIDQIYQVRTDTQGLEFGDVGFSGEKGTSTKDATFYDWYLTHPSKFPPDSDFQQQWVDFLKKYPQDHPKYERMKKALVASMIEQDGNVDEDFLEFYQSLLNTYRATGIIKE